MRYMLIHCVDERIELSPDQAAEVEASTSAWTEQAIRDGLSVHGAYLEPVCEARTVRLRASEVLVTDGPFAETKEQIGGYDVIECADLDQAIAVASRHPVAALGLHPSHGGLRARVAVAHPVAVRHLEEPVLRGQRPDPDRLEQHVIPRPAGVTVADDWVAALIVILQKPAEPSSGAAQ